MTTNKPTLKHRKLSEGEQEATSALPEICITSFSSKFNPQGRTDCTSPTPKTKRTKKSSASYYSPSKRKPTKTPLNKTPPRSNLTRPERTLEISTHSDRRVYSLHVALLHQNLHRFETERLHLRLLERLAALQLLDLAIEVRHGATAASNSRNATPTEHRATEPTTSATPSALPSVRPSVRACVGVFQHQARRGNQTRMVRKRSPRHSRPATEAMAECDQTLSPPPSLPAKLCLQWQQRRVHGTTQQATGSTNFLVDNYPILLRYWFDTGVVRIQLRRASLDAPVMLWRVSTTRRWLPLVVCCGDVEVIFISS